MFEGKKILVVDDEPDLREITAFEFEHKGAQVVTAEGGYEALEIVKTGGIDLIVSDVRMPEGSGEELLDSLNGENLLGSSPIILVTGFADISREEALRKGALELFYKPVKWVDVIEFAKDVLVK
jgi:CheY-like chemotaxis protein